MAVLVGRPVFSLSKGTNKVEYQIERLFGQEGYEYMLRWDGTDTTVQKGFDMIKKMLEDDKLYDKFNNIAKAEQIEARKHFDILDKE